MFALNHYYVGKHEMAISLFGDLLRMDLRNVLSDNCQYWIGECLYALGNYEEAITEFERVFAFIRSNKYDHAQTMLGFSYMKLGDQWRAKAEFESLLANYPTSKYTDLARKYLKKLQKL